MSLNRLAVNVNKCIKEIICLSLLQERAQYSDQPSNKETLCALAIIEKIFRDLFPVV